MTLGTTVASSIAAGDSASQRRIACATITGTTVERYDFFICATSAGRVSSSGEAYLRWGWRVPSLVSVVLVVVGFLIRRSVEESPEIAKRGELSGRGPA